MLERRNDTVVIDGVGHVIGLILEIVRCVAHRNADIDGVHQRDVIAGVAKWAGMCGAMAGEEYAAPILLGLGLDEFSMSATQILKARKIINGLSKKEMEEVAAEAVNKQTADEVLEFVKSKLAK